MSVSLLLVIVCWRWMTLLGKKNECKWKIQKAEHQNIQVKNNKPRKSESENREWSKRHNVTEVKFGIDHMICRQRSAREVLHWKNKMHGMLAVKAGNIGVEVKHYRLVKTD